MDANAINVNVEALALQARFIPAIQQIALALIAPKAALSDDDRKANEEAATTVAQKVKDYVRETAAAGITPEAANATLRQGLQSVGIPNGTALNYGRAAEGFRRMDDATMTAASVKDAQAIMRTDDQKAKDDVKEALRPMLRDATLEQLQAVLTYARTLNIQLKQRKVRADKGLPAEAAAPAAAPDFAEMQQQRAAA